MASRLRPSRDAELQEQASSFDLFETPNGAPEFHIDVEDGIFAPGAYRLSVETPDALLVQDGFVVLVGPDLGDDIRLVRLRLHRSMKRLCGDFILPANHRLDRFAPVVSSHTWRAGSLRIRPISDLEWRFRCLGEWAWRRVTKPRRLLSDAASALVSLLRSGPSSLRTQLATMMAVHPSSEKAVSFDAFRQVVELNNGAILASAAQPASLDDAAFALSIVVPVYRTPPDWFAELLRSFNHQTDGAFEIVLVLDGPQPELEAVARSILESRENVTIEVLPTNGGVSAAGNAGILRASGRYVTIIDHDDRLDRNFVAAIRHAISNGPADLYFADEAVTDSEMKVVRNVATRGQFDLRHYLSHPYIVHPVVVRRQVAKEAGLFDEALTVSQDVDFFLRCLLHSKSIVRIPLLLYYWRTHGNSLGHHAADRVLENTKAAIAGFLRTATGRGDFEIRQGGTFNTFEIIPPLPTDARAAIIIPTRNARSLLAACIASIEDRRSCNRTPADIVVIDHRSDDPDTLRFLSEASAAGRIRVLRDDGPWNYAAINNRAASIVMTEEIYSHLVFMNNDVELSTEDWLDRLIAQFSYADVGAVGCCLTYPDGRVQHGGIVIGLAGAADHAYKFEPLREGIRSVRRAGYLCGLTATRDVGAVTGALMVVPSPLFRQMDGFDERFQVGFNDVDLCLRLKEKGCASTYVGSVVALHHESVSRRSTEHPGDTKLFRERWGRLIAEGDEHYGAMMDWSSPMAVTCLKRQKPFSLREVRTGYRTFDRQPKTVIS